MTTDTTMTDVDTTPEWRIEKLLTKNDAEGRSTLFLVRDNSDRILLGTNVPNTFCDALVSLSDKASRCDELERMAKAMAECIEDAFRHTSTPLSWN